MAHDDDDLDQLLSFSLPSARGGRKPKGVAVWFGEARELGEADFALLMNPQSLGDKPPAVKTLRATHHALARALAAGHKPGMAGSMTGYSPSRVSILQADPAFQELVEYYRTEVGDVFIDAQKRLADLGVDAISELQERLEDEPGSFANKDLMALVTLTMDRSVAPPKSKPEGQGSGPAALPPIQINFISPPAEPAPSAALQITLDPEAEAGA